MQTVDVESCSLELLFYEERCGHVYATVASARGVRAALAYLTRPVIKAARIRVAIQEVVIKLRDKVARVLNRVCLCRLILVVVDEERGHRRASQTCSARRVRERDVERLASFRVAVIIYQHRDALTCFAGRENQMPRRELVIALLRCRPIARLVINRNRIARRAVERDRERRRNVAFRHDIVRLVELYGWPTRRRRW